MPAAELPACVFCGRPIGPDDETSGRAPMAAHAACADAALADDAHWDAIDAGGQSPNHSPAPARASGCLVLLMLAALAMLLTLLLPRYRGFRDAATWR